MKTSAHLSPGAVYSRDDLRVQFGIADATINTGVFCPKGHDSIWLFVTEHKTSDRTQYEDRLEREGLFWQGQTGGRTDQLIIQHANTGLELLLFYRKKKLEFPKAGFRFAGVFEYSSHFGSHPTSFYLRRVHVAQSVCYSQVRDTPQFAVHEGCPPNEQQLHRNVRTLSETLDWLAGFDRVSVAELRSYLLPLDLLPAALLDELNERALDLTGELAVEAVGDEILVTKSILARVVGHSN